MTLRRVTAFAQALALIGILVPGLHPVEPALVRAAIAPPRGETTTVFDANGRGIGCQTGTRTFKGPSVPRDPPWPPGAKPTPRPTPEASPETPADVATVDPSASPGPIAEGSSVLLAGGVLTAQAEPALEIEPVAEPAAVKKSQLLKGVDVSHHQNHELSTDHLYGRGVPVDFEGIREGGNRFVFIKATESTDWVDDWYARNMADARDAGLVVGAYHAFDYTVDGRAQADHFVARLKAVGGLDDAMPPAVDVECWSYRGTSTHATATGRLRDFVARFYRQTGRLPLVYTSAFMWQQVTGDAEDFGHLPLWAVCWDCDTPPIPAGWDDWSFWQTGARKVPGRPDKIDGNVFSGTKAQLDALKLRPVAIESGAPATGRTRVDLDLGGRYALHARTSLDGEQWSSWSRVRSAVRAQLTPEEGEQTVFVQLRAGPGLRSPTFSDTIMLDQTGPEATTPSVELRTGAVGNGPAPIPVSVLWSARDPVAGLGDATVSVHCGEGRVQRSEAPGSAAPDELAPWDAPVSLFGDADCNVTAVSRDGAGNATRTTVHGVQASRMPLDGASSGEASLQGDQVGIVARRGPDMGVAQVRLDGEAVAEVDLYSPEPSGPEIVSVVELDPAVTQALSVGATGARDPASTGTDILLEELIVLKGGRGAA